MKVAILGNGTKSMYVGDQLLVGIGEETRGGAYFAEALSGVDIHDKIFLFNCASKDGGGVFLRDCHSVSIKKCLFFCNFAKWGGAIYLEKCSDISISDNLFLFNFAYRDGGAISMSNCSRIQMIHHNHFIGNIGLRSCNNIEFHQCR